MVLAPHFKGFSGLGTDFAILPSMKHLIRKIICSLNSLALIVLLFSTYKNNVYANSHFQDQTHTRQIEESNSELAPANIFFLGIVEASKKIAKAFIKNFFIVKVSLGKFFNNWIEKNTQAKSEGPQSSIEEKKVLPVAKKPKPKPRPLTKTVVKKAVPERSQQPIQVRKSKTAAAPSPGKISFKYAKAGSPTKMRTHPRQVRDLKQVRKRNQIPKIQGVGFSFGGEMVFKNNVSLMKKRHFSSKGLKGADFVRALEEYSKGGACIPSLLLAGHGWGSPIAVYGKKIDSIAKNHVDRNNGVGLYRKHSKSSAVSIEGTLAMKIKSREINFCNECEIMVHACNMSKEFGSSLAKTSGCRVVAADFQVSPVGPKSSDSWSAFPDDGRYDHVWFTSAKGNFFEYLPDGRREVIGKGFIFDPAL